MVWMSIDGWMNVNVDEDIFGIRGIIGIGYDA